MQQINLLTEDLMARSESLQAQHLILVWSGVVAILFAFTVWQGFTVWGLNRELADTRVEIADLVAANAQQRAQLVDPSELRAQLGELRDRQLLQGALVEQLRGQQNKGGFSPYLQGLAKARVEGLWLTNINLQGGSGGAADQLTLKGTTVNPRLVPKLLQGLAELPAFQGKRFQQLELYANPDGGPDNSLVEFIITSPQKELPQGMSG
jgi:type IV pilus assembly PilN-like protein